MNIVISSPVVTLSSPLTIDFSDAGSAHVSITLAIGDQKPIIFEETYEGTRRIKMPISKGSYDCTIIESAYKAGALGPAYDSEISINAIKLATAQGSIKNTNSDHDFKHFTINIV